MNRIVVKLFALIMMMGCTMCNNNQTRHQIRHQQDHQHQLQQEFNKNFQLVSQWRCGTPKPRLVYLEDAIGGPPTINPDTYWVVKTAVLHRCQPELGCCDPPRTCNKTSETRVTITFRAMNMLTHTITYPQLEFRNHTSCGCLSPND